jgi:hypothetical protein
VHTSCDSRTAIVFVSEGSERVKTATFSFKLNQYACIYMHVSFQYSIIF